MPIYNLFCPDPLTKRFLCFKIAIDFNFKGVKKLDGKFWISANNRQVFALWLQAKVNFFMRDANCFFADTARWYKHQFDLLDLEDEPGHCMQNDEIAVSYDLFVSDLCSCVS